MENKITMEREDGSKEEFVGGKDFVEAVARAGSKEELGRILKQGGVTDFSEEDLAANYANLALSQDWKAVLELFQDTDFESCKKKLGEHGLTTTRENFDLINEVIRMAADEALVRELLPQTDADQTMELLHSHGYTAVTAEFLLLVQESARNWYEDALLTQEELRALSGKDFMERYQKSINLVFALSCIAELALGVQGMSEPALLIAIAGGISLMYGEAGGNEA